MRANLCMVPPMGWNSWNTFAENINEELICQTADIMQAEGMAQAGYRYIVIDDCWALRERDEQGRLVPDPVKFPHGMKAVSDYVHSKGFLFGMYSCCGTRTCAGYPGSFEHEFEDARQFAEWGVDYLKYDNCFRPQHMDCATLYRRMGLALANSDRDMVFSACQWGVQEVHDWIRSTPAHLFRSTVDINDCWNSIRDIALSQMDRQSISGPFCHNDMDMLVVGMHGAGGTDYIAAGGCTDEEYQTHFALWCMMNSPLMLGCDVRGMTEATRRVIMNRDLIAINQDVECRAPFRVSCESNPPEGYVLAKFLSNGDIAIGMFNLGDVAANLSVDLWDLGLGAKTGCRLALYDCIAHQDAGTEGEMLLCKIPAHGCKVFRGRLEMK